MERYVRQFYRFAIYGRSGSGKSCYLGTLALNASGEGGLTCDRLPVQVPKPDASKEQLTDAEREALGLHEGKKWLDRIIVRLEKGDLPDPNSPELGRALPTVDFRIGDPSRGTSVIRLVDYSGELINPELEYDPESFVRKLRTFLAESDGFLVFAEVARQNDSTGGPWSPDLLRLGEAFASLQESKAETITTPACVVLTKWDRQSTINWDNPSTELEKLERFLEEHSEYQGLINSMRNALAPQPAGLAEVEGGRDSASLAEAAGGSADFVPKVDHGPASPQPAGRSSATPGEKPVFRRGLTRGNTCVFPVSSFGDAKRDDGRELPPSPLRPFGLLEPLLWLVERRDVLDVAELEQRWKQCRWKRLAFAFLLSDWRAIRRDADRLSSRIPPHTQSGRRLARLSREIWQSAVICSGLTLILLLLFIVVGISCFRSYQFRKHAAIAGDPTLAWEQIDQLKRFFRRYIAWGRWNGFFVPSVDEAKQHIEQLNQREDELLWATVQSAPDLATKAKAAYVYLERLPNGKHASESRSLVQQWEEKTAKREGEEKNRQWLDDCASQLAVAKSTDDIDKLIEQLNHGFPEPNYVTLDQMAKRDDLRAEADKRRGQVAWTRFVESYRQELSQGRLRDAAGVLVKHAPRNAQWRGLAEKFPKDVDEFLEKKTRVFLEDAQFSQARDSLKEALDALSLVESILRGDDAALADAMLKGQQEVHKTWGAKIDEQEDRTLYESVRKIKDKRACDKYLQNAPLKVMEPQVKAYKAYLEELDGELECTVELKILWEKNYKPDFGEGENYISVSVDGKFVQYRVGPTAEDPGNISGPICKFLLEGKRGKSFEIEVSVTEDDLLNKDDGGSGKQNFTLEDLARERKTIPLRPADGGFQNVAELQVVQGWPVEPPLPEWDKGKRAAL